MAGSGWPTGAPHGAEGAAWGGQAGAPRQPKRMGKGQYMYIVLMVHVHVESQSGVKSSNF